MVQVVKNFVRKIEKTILRYSMLDDGDRILVAVSGGPDSVVLLDVLDRLKEALSLELVVAHFDHRLRPDDDDRETRFVASLAAMRNLPFVTQKALSPLGKNGISLEEAARNRRYEFLNDARKTHGLQKIALGHTLDDQAETVIMRLLRGSGPAGLSGIPPVRDRTVIRPLIEVTRQEVEDYMARRMLPHITDPSNLEREYLRNRIRLDLLPQLKTYQPRILEILAQTAGIMRDDAQWMETEAKKWIKGHVEVLKTGKHSVPLKSFRELAASLQNQVIRQVIKGVQGGLRRMGLRHIDAVKNLLEGRPQAHLNLPGGILVQKTYETLMFTRNRKKPIKEMHKGYAYRLNGPGVISLDAISCKMTVRDIKATSLLQADKESPWCAHLDADRMEYPLMIRSFGPGDRFVPLGMTGHKKVKDFFMDLKIPSHIRKSLPLLCHENGIIWVCGLRIDEGFKVHPETKRVVRVSLDFANGPLADFFLNHPSKQS